MRSSYFHPSSQRSLIVLVSRSRIWLVLRIFPRASPRSFAFLSYRIDHSRLWPPFLFSITLVLPFLMVTYYSRRSQCDLISCSLLFVLNPSLILILNSSLPPILKATISLRACFISFHMACPSCIPQVLHSSLRLRSLLLTLSAHRVRNRARILPLFIFTTFKIINTLLKIRHIHFIQNPHFASCNSSFSLCSKSSLRYLTLHFTFLQIHPFGSCHHSVSLLSKS